MLFPPFPVRAENTYETSLHPRRDSLHSLRTPSLLYTLADSGELDGYAAAHAG